MKIKIKSFFFQFVLKLFILLNFGLKEKTAFFPLKFQNADKLNFVSCNWWHFNDHGKYIYIKCCQINDHRKIYIENSGFCRNTFLKLLELQFVGLFFFCLQYLKSLFLTNFISDQNFQNKTVQRLLVIGHRESNWQPANDD